MSFFFRGFLMMLLRTWSEPTQRPGRPLRPRPWKELGDLFIDRIDRHPLEIPDGHRVPRAPPAASWHDPCRGRSDRPRHEHGHAECIAHSPDIFTTRSMDMKRTVRPCRDGFRAEDTQERAATRRVDRHFAALFVGVSLVDASAVVVVQVQDFVVQLGISSRLSMKSCAGTLPRATPSRVIQDL